VVRDVPGLELGVADRGGRVGASGDVGELAAEAGKAQGVVGGQRDDDDDLVGTSHTQMLALDAHAAVGDDPQRQLVAHAVVVQRAGDHEAVGGGRDLAAAAVGGEDADERVDTRWAVGGEPGDDHAVRAGRDDVATERRGAERVAGPGRRGCEVETARVAGHIRLVVAGADTDLGEHLRGAVARTRRPEDRGDVRGFEALGPGQFTTDLRQRRERRALPQAVPIGLLPARATRPQGLLRQHETLVGDAAEHAGAFEAVADRERLALPVLGGGVVAELEGHTCRIA